MRFRLFLILIGVVVLSLASGLGLRYALAWTEPGADPPDGNVPKPINIGTDSQTKFGDLTVGGNFVVSKGQIVGVPGGGNMGVGTLNAEQLCIQGNCRNNWPEAVNAFVDEGNIGFGPTAILGTNDNVPLSFETNGVGRVQIGAAGNVGIGTTNTAYNLMVGGTAPRIYLLPAPGSNPELDFGSPAMDTHWSIYRDAATDQLRFWRTDNKLILTSGGNVGISTDNPLYKLTVAGTAPREYLWPSGGGNPELDFGNQAGDTHWAIYRDATTDQLRFWRDENRLILASNGNVGVGVDPAYKLDVAGQINASTNLSPAIRGTSSASDGRGVYGAATNAAGSNYGGYFEAAGDNGIGVYGLSSNAAGSGAGGFFQSDGAGGIGVYGITSGQGSSGFYGLASGESGAGVSGTASSLVGLNKGGSFFAGNPTVVTSGDNNIGVMAAGGGSAGKNYGGYFKAQGTGYGVYSTVTDASAWSGYFTGGQGLYADAGVMGAAAGGYRGSGTLNAAQLCIQGNCLGAWPAGVAPGGVAGQIQFNDGGIFTGDTGLTFDKAADILTVGGNLKVGMAAAGNDDYIYFDDGSKYIMWQDGNFRFNFSDSIFSQGQISATSFNTYQGGAIMAYDVANQKSVRFRHDGTNGIVETYTAFGVDTGNLVLQSTFAGRNVTVDDDLAVNNGVTVGGIANMGIGTLNATQLCIANDCRGAWPAAGGTDVQLQGSTPGTQQIGHLNISGTGIFGGLKIDALNGVLKAAGGTVSGGATTTDLAEGANLYYTDARARAAISAGAGPVNYTPATGVLSFASPLAIFYGGTGGSDSPTVGGVAYGTGAKYSFTAAGAAGQFLQSNGAGAPTWAAIPGGVGGSGSTNYLAKFTAGATVGNSQIYDDGTNVTISGKLGIGWSPATDLDVRYNAYVGGNLGLGTYAPSYKLHVVGDIYSTGTLRGSALSVSGDLTASNNTLSSCSWVSVPSNTTYYSCVDLPSAGNNKIMAGIYKNASGVVTYIQCCEL